MSAQRVGAMMVAVALTLGSAAAAQAQSSEQAGAEGVGVARGVVRAALARASLQEAAEAEEGALWVQRMARAEGMLGLELYRLGEDWRAVSAMQRYQLLARSQRAAYLSSLVVGEIYHRNARAELAMWSFEQASYAAPDRTARAWVELMRTQQVCAVLDRWAECVARLDMVSAEGLSDAQREVVNYQRGVARVMLRQAPGEGSFTSEGYEARWHALEGESARFDALPRKRPVLAGVLSALLPGAGQVYNGQWRDGAIALGLTGAAGGALYYSVARRESVGLSVLSGVVLASFYAGGVMNAYVDASRHNARVYEVYFEEIKAQHWLRVGFEIERDVVRYTTRFDWETPVVKMGEAAHAP